MKTLLICHSDSIISKKIISSWLQSFSELSGIVIISETKNRFAVRVKHEIKRVGILRFLDVLLFRVYYRLFLSKKDKLWEKNIVEGFERKNRNESNNIPIIYTQSPNSLESKKFIKNINPDILIARCKTILKENIFSIPSKGSLVFHPGICPQYRNAHGCFWALSNNDLKNVGMTLLKIDKGIDTGPIYGYYTYKFNEINESHIIIQNRVVIDNLDKIKMKIIDIYNDKASPLVIENKKTKLWGQPWLSKYIKWKFNAYMRK